MPKILKAGLSITFVTAGLLLAGCGASGPPALDGILSFDGTYTQTILLEGGKEEHYEGAARAMVECAEGTCTLDEIMIDDGGGSGFYLFDESLVLEETVAFTLAPESPECNQTSRPDFPQGVEVTGSFSAERLQLQIESPMIMPLDANGGVICYAWGQSTSFEGTPRR